jgi:DNA polymerase III alpha subunit
MKLDYYQNAILTTDELIQHLLQGGDADGVFLDDKQQIESFNRSLRRLTDFTATVMEQPDTDMDLFDYHSKLSEVWTTPSKYYKIDLESWLLERTKNDQEKQRVLKELEMYQERNLEGLLRCMIYLVDWFRENNILWGVGRGSSVSSFILYLIGINRINPLKYNLHIEDFLK